MTLPVFNEKFNDIERIEKIKELNIETFYRKCYGNLCDTFTTFPTYLYKEIHSIISWLRTFQYKYSLFRQNDSCLLDKLINDLYNFTNQIYQKYNKCYARFNFNELKKDIDEIHKQIIECLNYIKKKNIATKEKEVENTIDQKINEIHLQFEEINKKFNKCKNIKKLNNEYIQNNFNRILQEHYSVFEYDKLTFPILVLIQSSPFALNEFLNGDWDSFDISFDLSFLYQQDVRNSKFLTKLIHLAFIDLMGMPNIFENGVVESISFNSYCPSDVNHIEIIEVEDYRKSTEYRNNLLDKYYSEISYDRLRNIEGSSLKIKLKHLYELSFYLSFTANTTGSNQKISFSLSIDITPDIEYYLFRIRELKDANSLISKLKKTDNTIYNHIRKLLSNKMQNIILHYDTSLQPSIRLKQELLEELNLIVLKPELCSKGACNELAKGNNELKNIIENISNIDLSFKDLIQMVHESSSYNLSTEIRITNKSILQKIFEDEFELEDYSNTI